MTNRLPSISSFYEHVQAGGLMAYAAKYHATYRRNVALVIDKIFKGTKPGDLPVQQPTEFELILNLKTAKALGLEIPATLRPRRRGDRVGLASAYGLLHLLTAGCAQVFGRRQSRALPRAHAAGVRKAPRHEIAAGGSAAAVPQALWG